jgi:hypothetical protein
MRLPIGSNRALVSIGRSARGEGFCVHSCGVKRSMPTWSGGGLRESNFLNFRGIRNGRKFAVYGCSIPSPPTARPRGHRCPEGARPSSRERALSGLARGYGRLTGD